MTTTPSPEVLVTALDDIDADVVARAANVLRAGGLVAIPTETVYGLGCNALDPVAVARVFEAKGRPATDPLIVHVDGLDMAASVVDGPLPPAAATLAAAFWPGPLTMVLPRAAIVPTTVTSGLESVGVRCPSHPVAAAIISAAGLPVAAPSANPFGRISPTTAQHVVDDLGSAVDVVVDAGPSERGLESTVVAFDGDEVVVLRHGAVTAEELASHVVVRTVAADDDATMASPGHDERHYAPRTPAIAVATGVVSGESGPPSLAVVYAGYDDHRPALPEGWHFHSLGSRAALDDVARELYGGLRRIDALPASLILLELTGGTGIGRAIDDRLTRAASSIVVTTPAELTAAMQRLGPPA